MSLSQTDDNCREAKSQWNEEMVQRMTVLYILIKVEDISGYVVSQISELDKTP